ncbi:thymidylate kinase [Desulfonauticus submarinus]|uniref:Thymidylate kinase n=1 Tax=Desulfonauticus submarinus TaxID=206665 RepID=A0A1G9ZWB4_9BACT|nr:dTMP kinase [Desulfonauticus submarinus]SDN25719.1 thymidylate kinase [Desulfonauticus submarinus]
MFITFEGIEGCGKTTQAQKLKEYLESLGKKVLLTREPGGSNLGITLRKILLSMESQDITKETELFLYLADRSQHVHQIIKPALEEGSIVISDRYTDSTVVYQGYGRGIDPNILHLLNELATNKLNPDLTILLDLPVEIGLKRALARNLEDKISREEGRFEAESLEFHTKIREGYLTWAALHKERIIVINGNNEPEIVFKDILEAIKNRITFNN